MGVTVKALGSDKPSESLVPSDSTSHSHTVVFYEEGSLLLDTLAQSIADTLLAGNSAIVIATLAHHNGLFDRLRDRGAAFHTAILESRLFLLDAAETLSRFMVDDQPDPDLFAKVMSNHIKLLTAAARGKGCQVFAFGEMVAVLWQEGQYAAALHVEKLWNELAASHSFHLCCAYPLHLFPDTTARQNQIPQINAHHTHIICAKHPSEQYPSK
jgi:hypothetical protein